MIDEEPRTLADDSAELYLAACRKIAELRKELASLRLKAEDRDAALEESAKIADYWGGGNWLYNANGRKRFTERDMQTLLNTTGRAIAEDIRALKTSSTTSGDRTENAPIKTSVEP